jgi:hypothetical protein
VTVFLSDRIRRKSCADSFPFAVDAESIDTYINVLVVTLNLWLEDNRDRSVIIVDYYSASLEKALSEFVI